jgi:hypothetical protein
MMELEDQAARLFIKTKLQNKIDRSISAHHKRHQENPSFIDDLA